MTDELVKNDLIDYADIPQSQGRASSKPKTEGDEDYGYGRLAWMQASLPDEAEIVEKSTGGYQGKKVFVLSLDGYIWMIDTYYGSCSYCDGFIGNEKGETENLIRSARCFESKDDVISWLKKSEDEVTFMRGYSDQMSVGTIESLIEEVGDDGGS